MIKPFFDFFVRRFALFFLPVAFLLLCPAWVLWVSGEWTSIDEVIRRQQIQKEPLMLGLAYSNPAKYYKLQSLIARNAELVMMGNSHVMAAREDFFKPRSFYNAAVGGSRLPDFERLISQVPQDRQPKVIIVGLDPFFAKPDFDWSQKEEDRFDRRAGSLDAIRILGTSWKNVYSDLLSKKFSLSQLTASRKGKDEVAQIGLEAIVHGSGFLNDGAYYNPKAPGPATEDTPDYSHLKEGETYDERGLEMLEQFLDICYQRHIHVVGFLPPARERVYETLNASGYVYWKELPTKLEPMFSRRGFSVFDFSRPSSYGGDDSEFYDDFHASEAAYSRIADKLSKLEALSKP